MALAASACVAEPEGLTEAADAVRLETLSTWSAAGGAASGAASGGARPSAAETALARDLYAMFPDQTARALVEEALANNTDLRAAALRVEAVVQARRIADARRGPNASLNAQAQSGRADGLDVEGGAIALEASWSLDLWGRLAAESAAAAAEYDAARADRDAARLSIANLVMRGWVRLWAAHRETELLDARIADLEALRDLTAEAFRAGLAPLEDRADARAQVELARARRAAAAEAELSAARELELLLGRPPAGLVEAASFAPEIAFPPLAPPAEVLAARPDITAAYARLEGSVLQARSAARALLPDLTLGASLSEPAGALADVSQWSAVASLGQVLFDGGALTAQARAQGVEAEIALESYRGAVLSAIEEVERGLSNEASLRDQIEATRAALEAARSALEDGEASYRSGLVDFRTLLSRRLQVSEVETALVQLRGAWLANRLSLALALGVGPQTAEEPADG